MKTLILAAVLAFTAPVPVAQAADPDPGAGAVPVAEDATGPVVAVVDAFHAALGSGDAGAVLALLAEDLMVLEEGGAERSREEYAGHHLLADMAFAAATHAAVARRSAWIAGDMAWVLSEGRTSGQFNGRAVDRLTAETMILQRQADGWRIRHIHWSSRVPR